MNQSVQGTDKVNAIINCHLATGRIGQPGMGPFSLTGQPNAMGGREVGGLANQLAAHMDFDAGERGPRAALLEGARPWRKVPGLKAVDLFEAVEDGRIKALVGHGHQPGRQPAARRRDARTRCASSTCSSSPRRWHRTTRLPREPHVLLPAAAWGEKDGTVTNSERRISRQRAFLVPPGEAKPDWWIVCEVAKRMGFGKAFAYHYPSEIFREHAALSAFENDGTRDFDLGGLTRSRPTTITNSRPCNGRSPRQYQRRPAAPVRQRPLLHAGRTGALRPDRSAARSPRRPRSAYPYLLNTGRVRDHWHTMTRTGKSPRLSGHIDEPFVEISPRGRRRAQARRRRARKRDVGPWQRRLAGPRERRPAAGRDFRADPLE